MAAESRCRPASLYDRRYYMYAVSPAPGLIQHTRPVLPSRFASSATSLKVSGQHCLMHTATALSGQHFLMHTVTAQDCEWSSCDGGRCAVRPTGFDSVRLHSTWLDLTRFPAPRLIWKWKVVASGKLSLTNRDKNEKYRAKVDCYEVNSA